MNSKAMDLLEALGDIPEELLSLTKSAVPACGKGG